MSQAGPFEHFVSDWLSAGWAFVLAVVGWIWHAGRLASKVDQLERQLAQHILDEGESFDAIERRQSHMSDKLDALAGTLNYIRGKVGNGHSGSL